MLLNPFSLKVSLSDGGAVTYQISSCSWRTSDLALGFRSGALDLFIGSMHSGMKASVHLLRTVHALVERLGPSLKQRSCEPEDQSITISSMIYIQIEH